MGISLSKIVGVARHRLSTDGDGVTTLVAFMAVLSVADIVLIRSRWATEAD